MIRKTTREFKRHARTYERKKSTETHTELVRRETWWFLFIPLFSQDYVLRSNI